MADQTTDQPRAVPRPLAEPALAVLSLQKTVAGVTLLWAVFCLFQNGEFASLSAAIPDHVPVRQRATVAGWVGMPQALGLVVGTILVVAVFTGLISGYLVLAVLLALFTLPFVPRWRSER
jgi:MFS family permease